jgi:predicted peptidase
VGSIAAWLLALSFAAYDWPTARGLHQLQADIPDAGRIRYAVSVPDGYDPAKPTPLVLVLHPGGERIPYYGAQFTRRIVEPALRQLRPIMIAPDCPPTAAAWANADTAVMALIADARRAYNIDPRRILVVGYSMGGRGTWHFASQHQDVFTAAIPMAASARNLEIDQLGRQPTYIIHSRADEVVPFEPAEDIARELRKQKRDVEFEALDDFTHFDMVSYIDALSRAGRWVAAKWKH